MDLLELRGMLPEDIKVLLEQLKEQSFRANQIFSWLQQHGVTDISQMSNLSKELRQKLIDQSYVNSLELVRSQESKDGTKKYLWQLRDKSLIETVLMVYRGDKNRWRNTVCLSTQVGCAMGCSFCATGQGGYIRNLQAGEIVSQVLDIQNLMRLEERDFKITNLVYMGMGEPLNNYDNVIKSIKIFNHQLGQNIGIRRITVSTCGIVPKILKLAQEKLDIVLAISLHAPNDNLRNQIMPINHQYPMGALKDACQQYIVNTNRRITFEYALVKGFNDELVHARELASFLKSLLANVNLIPVNPVSDPFFSRPQKEKIRNFVKELNRLGIEAVIREEKGTDIDAACGQLRGKHSDSR